MERIINEIKKRIQDSELRLIKETDAKEYENSSRTDVKIRTLKEVLAIILNEDVSDTEEKLRISIKLASAIMYSEYQDTDKDFLEFIKNSSEIYLHDIDGIIINEEWEDITCVEFLEQIEYS